MFAQVVFPLPFRNSFTYSVSAELSELVQLGVRVVVPFGKRTGQRLSRRLQQVRVTALAVVAVFRTHPAHETGLSLGLAVYTAVFDAKEQTGLVQHVPRARLAVPRAGQFSVVWRAREVCAQR